MCNGSLTKEGRRGEGRGGGGREGEGRGGVHTETAFVLQEQARTSYNLWGHVSDGTHGVCEGARQLLGRAKVTEL